MWKPIQFLFFFKIPIPVLLINSHMGENLETNFQPGFHPKWKQSIFHVKIKLRIGSPSENHPTLVCDFFKTMIINHMNQNDTYGTSFFLWQYGARFCPSRRLCDDPNNQIKGEFAKQCYINCWMLLVCTDYWTPYCHIHYWFCNGPD